MASLGAGLLDFGFDIWRRPDFVDQDKELSSNAVPEHDIEVHITSSFDYLHFVQFIAV
jgi:hypothetical protein